MIHEEICTYEVAKLAEEKGFPQAFNYNHFKSKWDYYNYKGELNGDVGDILKLRIKHKPIPEDIQPITAPTQSLLQRWLREEKGVQICIDNDLDFDDEKFVYEWQIAVKENFDNGGFEIHRYNSEECHSTYELALEDALKYALINLI